MLLTTMVSRVPKAWKGQGGLACGLPAGPYEHLASHTTHTFCGHSAQYRRDGVKSAQVIGSPLTTRDVMAEEIWKVDHGRKSRSSGK